MDTYYARSKFNRPVCEWQDIYSHLQNVATQSSIWASKFSSTNWAWNAGWLHDIGKMSNNFQEYLLFSTQSLPHVRVNHSAAGATYAETKLPGSGRVLAYLCAGHHAGLADYSGDGKGSLIERLKEGDTLLKSVGDLSLIQEQIRNLIPPPFVNEKNFHFWIRMLFSCLVDADRLDAEQFSTPHKLRYRDHFPDISTLLLDFNQYMNCFQVNNKINKIRADVLQRCRNVSQQKPGMYSLNVPTGGGKTLSGMAFALEHCVQHSKNRVIYVAPYTTIIEQTASIFKGISKNWSRGVIEHHCNLDPVESDEVEQLAIENWDAPVVITTNVQFFESLLSDSTTRCRKLHNIVNSVVILDEAQLIPPEKLSACVHVMNELVSNYGVTFLLSTATQPVLPNLLPATEIVQNVESLHRKLRRIHVDIQPQSIPVNWSNLAWELKKYSQVLCVLNTREDCYKLWEQLKIISSEDEIPFHLSTLLCGAHRSDYIHQIKQRLQAGQSVRVISTQLIEAGVDVDFPVVYRAFAGLDSIIQSGGRCNREGKADSGLVKVFNPPTPILIGLLGKARNTMLSIFHKIKDDILNPNSFRDYYNSFYSRLLNTGEEFLGLLTVNSSGGIQFRTVGTKFKLIDEETRPVLVPYKQGQELIDQLKASGMTRELSRKLQRYTVSLRPNLIAKNQSFLSPIGEDYLVWVGPRAEQIDVNIFEG